MQKASQRLSAVLAAYQLRALLGYENSGRVHWALGGRLGMP